MAMPEAPMNKNDRVVFFKYEVRFAGQVAGVQTVTVSKAMKSLAYKLFRLGVL